MGLFSRKRREPKPEAHPTFARLLNLAIVGLVIYMIVTNMGSILAGKVPTDGKDCAPPADPQTTQQKALDSYYIHAAEISALDRLRISGSKEIVSNRKPGDGPVLACGQQMEYRLQVKTYENRTPDAAFRPFAGKVEKITIGDISTPRGELLQLMSTGLRIGGTADFAFPRSALMQLLSPGTPTGKDETAAVATIEVLSATPAAPISKAPTPIIETQRANSSHALRCGGTAQLAIRSWRMDGTPLPVGVVQNADDAMDTQSNSANITARLGSGQLPYGIERAAEGMSEGAVRMVVIPTDFLAPFPKAATDLPLLKFADHSQMILAEITVSPPQENTAPQAAEPETEEPAPSPPNSQSAPAEAALDNQPTDATIPSAESEPTPSTSSSK